MTLSGKDDLRDLTSSLDAKRLVRLTADVLAVLGHSALRIVDGPGDGGRDVHAVAHDNEKVLAQCKFHEDPTKTCSSAETSELPMALIKLGYKRGIFVTNAGISPQAKREYLDNYPGLQLAFLDGDQLVRLVLQEPLLKALWFDGSSLTDVTSVVTVPVMIREHNADAPIVPARWDPAPDLAPIAEGLSATYPGLVFSVGEADLEPHLFEPYRYPEPFTEEEGMMPFLRAMVVHVRGALRIGAVPELTRSIAEGFARFVGARWSRFTVRIGKLRVTPLVGEGGGLPVDGVSEAASFVTTTELSSTPEVLYLATSASGWTYTSDARVSEADYIRLYQPELDACAAYEVVGRPSDARLTLLRAQNERTMAGWNGSVHALLPSFATWQHSIPTPDDTIAWPWDGRQICTWFHGTLLSEVAVCRTINEADNPFAALLLDRTGELESIRTYLSALSGATMLKPDECFHMVSALGARVLVDVNKMTTRTADVTHHPEQLPSPVLPTSRRIEILTAWKLPESVPVESLTREAEAGPMENAEVHFDIDGDYLVARWLVPSAALVDASTAIVLERVTRCQRVWLERLEAHFRCLQPHLARATRAYWFAKHNVALGTKPSDSAKVFMWVPTKDGGWAPGVAGRRFDPSSPEGTHPEGLPDGIAKLVAAQRRRSEEGRSEPPEPTES